MPTSSSLSSDLAAAVRPPVGSSAYALDFLNPLSRPPPGGYSLPPQGGIPDTGMPPQAALPPAPAPEAAPLPGGGALRYLMDFLNPLSRPPSGGYSR